MELCRILDNKRSAVHFIGIGGVSMSSLAKLLFSDGHKITGSDTGDSSNVRELKELGITVYPDQRAENIKECDLIVYTAAIKEDNPELKRAFASGIPTVERCVLLGEMMKKYKCPVNVAGTHGKTTTTSMLASVFVCADTEPTVSVGGNYPAIGGNLLIGSKDYFICEACEYVESFLKFYPAVSVILNIEEDHLDYFRNLDHIKEAFLKFAKRTSDTVIFNGDEENCKILRNLGNIKTYTFGIDKTNDYYPENITRDEKGRYSFDVSAKGEPRGRISLSVPGYHNLKNALAAYAAADICGIPHECIKKGLDGFTGAERRFEFKGIYRGARIYDDYAHHPSEIEALLKTAGTIDKNKLYIVFQPHTYSRTQKLMSEFVDVLSRVENLIITKVYAAREKDVLGVNAKTLADNIPGCLYIDSFDKIEEYLKDNVKENDLVVTVGAGDVFKIGEDLLKQADAVDGNENQARV